MSYYGRLRCKAGRVCYRGPGGPLHNSYHSALHTMPYIGSWAAQPPRYGMWRGNGLHSHAPMERRAPGAERFDSYDSF